MSTFLKLPRGSLVAIPALLLVAAILLWSSSEVRCQLWGQACPSSAQPLRGDRPPTLAGGARSDPGRINFLRDADTAFAPYLTDSSKSQRRWMASTYWRMRGYHPHFALVGALRWAPPTHFYLDLYAIYRDEDRALMQQHPDWVLRDETGDALYIPFACENQSFCQFAGDIGNPAFRSWWISRATNIFASGYAGILIDDVSMEMRVSDGAGRAVAPIDPRTGQPMSLPDWRRYVAEFTEQIARALPEAEIAHNQGQWWVGHSDPHLRRQIAAADIIELERGYNDTGMTGGGGTFGFESFMAHIDWLHSRGKSVILEPDDLNAAKQEYEIAAYYLTKSGSDAIASDYAADPGNWSAAWETDLGSPLRGRYEWEGLWRRDYTGGIALVNQPDRPSRTVDLGPYRRLSDATVRRITLGAARGAVLLKDNG